MFYLAVGDPLAALAGTLAKANAVRLPANGKSLVGGIYIKYIFIYYIKVYAYIMYNYTRV